MEELSSQYIRETAVRTYLSYLQARKEKDMDYDERMAVKELFNEVHALNNELQRRGLPSIFKA